MSEAERHRAFAQAVPNGAVRARSLSIWASAMAAQTASEG